jgi:hypothetical protein
VACTPTLFSRYLGDAEATAAAFVELGGARYFRTGDVCEDLGGGRFAVRDRVSALARVPDGAGGFALVSPAQAEEAARAALDAYMHEHLCCVQHAAAASGSGDGGGGTLVLAASWRGATAAVSGASGGAAADAALAAARAACAAAGLAAHEAPGACVLLPEPRWRIGGLVNVHHKIARGAVAEAVRDALAEAAAAARA